ncbi:glycosyltransferase [Brevibacterium pigmentatum]|uniref:glycosyltransferase n=1 Tax=Brevibacterium pigmentatum TaxID=1496080 RepID=UPI00142479D3|nr:glycosyltransferase [Brevibacterium pigmentatum]
MTNSVLRRTNSFIRHGNPLSATILTFAHQLDVGEVRDRLVGTGLLDESVIIRNLWDDLRPMTDAQLLDAFSGENPTEEIPDAHGTRETITKNYTRFLGASGKVIRQEHYRDDGSRLFTDINEVKNQRRVILHNNAGEPIIEWDRARSLYNPWIQYVIDKEPSLLIVDSGPIATIAHELTDRNFKLAHFLHVSHLKHPLEGIYGQLTSNRVEAFREQEQFDIVAVQTQQQIDDMAKIGLSRKRMRLIPSELPPEAIRLADNTDRDETKGLVVARLVDLKQIDHAIDAVAKAKTTRTDISLDIAGTGEEQAQLQQLIDDHDHADDIQLLGHVNNVTDRLATASFSLLTSKFEGLGLAILESMAAGCIPITYDIKYGPAEIITHGVNGFIVPANDIDALAAQIEAFLAMPSNEKLEMRRAAIERAKDFLPEQSYERWKKALEEPVKIHNPAPFSDPEYLRTREIAITTSRNATKLGILFADGDNVENKNLRLIVASRSKNTFFQAVSSADGWQRTDGRIVYNFTLSNDLFSQAEGQTFDVYVRKIGARWDAKARLKLPAPFASVEAHGLHWYRTEYGNFSVKCLAGASE